MLESASVFLIFVLDQRENNQEFQQYFRDKESASLEEKKNHGIAMLMSIFKLRYGPTQGFVLSGHRKHSSQPLNMKIDLCSMWIWADTGFCVEWAQKTLKSAIKYGDRFVLYVDNLEGQKADRFKDAVSANRGLV